LLANIRARPISWEAQHRSGVIDEREVRTIKTIDKQRRDKRIDIVSKDLPKYAQLMASLVKKGKRADILQFTLVMLADLLIGITR
jgi:V-type H+-transporting ATPase subunit H